MTQLVEMIVEKFTPKLYDSLGIYLPLIAVNCAILGGAGMELRIDGNKITPKTGQSLLELIRELGLDGKTLSGRPLAAKIAGEVFTLNYVPLRQRDVDADRSSMRRAMAASGGVVQLLRYLGIYPNIEDYTQRSYIDLRQGCAVNEHPLHGDFLLPQDAAPFVGLLRTGYDTMHRLSLNRGLRGMYLAILSDYYRLHIPDFPQLRSAEVLRELFD